MTLFPRQADSKAGLITRQIKQSRAFHANARMCLRFGGGKLNGRLKRSFRLMLVWPQYCAGNGEKMISRGAIERRNDLVILGFQCFWSPGYAMRICACMETRARGCGLFDSCV
jgi:hypothetical protein